MSMGFYTEDKYYRYEISIPEMFLKNDVLPAYEVFKKNAEKANAKVSFRRFLVSMIISSSRFINEGENNNG